MVTQEDVFRAFKRSAIRRGYIRQAHSGRRPRYPVYVLSGIDNKREPRYKEYLKFREEFRYKGKKVSNARQYQFHVQGPSLATRGRMREERKLKSLKNQVKKLKEELKECR